MFCKPNEKQPKFDVSLQPPRFTIYSLMIFPFEKLLTDNLKTDGLIENSIWETLCHNCTWLLSTASINLIENVLIDFSKNVLSAMSFSFTTDVVPYF